MIHTKSHELVFMSEDDLHLWRIRKGGQEDFFELKKGAQIFFSRKKRGAKSFSGKKKGDKTFFTGLKFPKPGLGT